MHSFFPIRGDSAFIRIAEDKFRLKTTLEDFALIDPELKIL
jgi:hypothetical protein